MTDRRIIMQSRSCWENRQKNEQIVCSQTCTSCHSSWSKNGKEKKMFKWARWNFRGRHQSTDYERGQRKRVYRYLEKKTTCPSWQQPSETSMHFDVSTSFDYLTYTQNLLTPYRTCHRCLERRVGNPPASNAEMHQTITFGFFGMTLEIGWRIAPLSE